MKGELGSIRPDKIRDKDWVHKMGHTPSIMDLLAL